MMHSDENHLLPSRLPALPWTGEHRVTTGASVFEVLCPPADARPVRPGF
ncbi:MAG: hypothetical protein ACM3ZC_10005 [Bacteroidota bacterium]